MSNGFTSLKWREECVCVCVYRGWSGGKRWGADCWSTMTCVHPWVRRYLHALHESSPLDDVSRLRWPPVILCCRAVSSLFIYLFILFAVGKTLTPRLGCEEAVWRSSAGRLAALRLKIGQTLYSSAQCLPVRAGGRQPRLVSVKTWDSWQSGTQDTRPRRHLASFHLPSLWFMHSCVHSCSKRYCASQIPRNPVCLVLFCCLQHFWEDVTQKHGPGNWPHVMSQRDPPPY